MMPIKQRIFCISATPFCCAHLFLTFQALDFNMLHPHSAINLSLSALAFLLKVIFSSPRVPIFNSLLLTQINLSTTPTRLPCKCMKHTHMCAESCSLKHARTHTQARRQQPQRPHINKSAPLLVLSVTRSGEREGRRSRTEPIRKEEDGVEGGGDGGPVTLP